MTVKPKSSQSLPQHHSETPPPPCWQIAHGPIYKLRLHVSKTISRFSCSSVDFQHHFGLNQLLVIWKVAKMWWSDGNSLVPNDVSITRQEILTSSLYSWEGAQYHLTCHVFRMTSSVSQTWARSRLLWTSLYQNLLLQRMRWASTHSGVIRTDTPRWIWTPLMTFIMQSFSYYLLWASTKLYWELQNKWQNIRRNVWMSRFWLCTIYLTGNGDW